MAKHKKVMSMEVKLLGIKHWSDIGQISRVVALLEHFKNKYNLRTYNKLTINNTIVILKTQKLIITTEYKIKKNKILILKKKKPINKIENGVGVGLGKGI